MVAAGESGPSDLALVAVGGFGRKWLFPHSDVDILFLHSADKSEKEYKEAIRKFSQEMWDLRLKLSPTTRKLSECDKFDADNPEFTISLLDCRFLAGDRALFERLHGTMLPSMVVKRAKPLVQRLAEITRARHTKFGDTVFHLEPNVKDGPGGLRDYNVAHWLSLISAMELHRDWPKDENLLPVSIRKQFESALEFLMSVRCFLHFRHNRDDNTLTWEAQNDSAAGKGWCARSGGGAERGGLDADLLRQCAEHFARVRETAGGKSGDAAVALRAISAFAGAVIESGILGGGWNDFRAAAGRAARSGRVVADVPVSGATRAYPKFHD